MSAKDFAHPLGSFADGLQPFLMSYSAAPVVVKFGGELVEKPDLMRALAEDVLFLRSHGVTVILCHGGGPQLSRELDARGVRPTFVRGQRVTDDQTLKLTCQILKGELNSAVVALINSIESCAVGLCGIDFGLLQCRQLDPTIGWVGTVQVVNYEPLRALLSAGLVPVVASLGIGAGGQILNINADSAAAALASAAQASRFMLFTNVSGLYRSYPDPNSLIEKISASDLESLIPSLEAGMVPKVEAAILAIRQGASEVRILDGRIPYALIRSFEHGVATGTEITR